MDIAEFYSDRKLSAKVAQYLGSKDVEERFAKSAEDLSVNKCLIPVLGTQGAGKSSFLNAVLFGDIVLPVDADETTCIPTAVMYGENDDPEACVVLGDGKRIRVACSESGLADYVHQEKNPGNVKGVAQIEITVKNDLLKDGLVFVDLPGVGSITAANQKTTTEYLKKCTAAIFMLRTVPPITQSESVFIQGALPLMGRVFWVQNQWMDESKDEVQEGKEHNFSILKKIAAACRMPESTIAEPEVVCVKRALDGKVTNDEKMVKTSGIVAFRDAVVAFARDWRKQVSQGKRDQAVELLTSAIDAAERKAEQLESDEESARAKIREEKKHADMVLDENSKLVRAARDYLVDRESEMKRFIEVECRKSAENLRNGVRASIDGGLVGGDQLNKAFNDYLQREHENLFHALQPEFIKVGTDVQQMLMGLQDVLGPKLVSPQAGGTHKFSDKTKIHEYYGSVGGVAGGIVGVKAGLTVGSYVGTVIGGPVGTAVGAAVGLIVSSLGMLFGGFCGRKMRELQLEKQKAEAQSELFKAVEKFVTEEKKVYLDAYVSFVSKLETYVKGWLKTQKEEVDLRYRTASAELSKPADEKKAEAAAIRCDVEKFKSMLKEVEAA